MSINHLILQNLKNNIKNYYLYVFSLIFTVALYFSFVTLQFDLALEETKESIKGAASIRTASVLLVVIVSIFLLYANNIFIKRRSKEIGLFQLIGMTKGKIWGILTLENLILYYGSLIFGIFIGFSVSKLVMMILLKILGVETAAALRFSTEAWTQTVVVFTVIYLFIMLMNDVFIRKQTILSLFNVLSSTEEKIKKVSVSEMFIGILGILLIATGYYISSKLFGGDFQTMSGLFLAMVFILASVIIGTYLFYKGSVRFIFYMIRKKKDGYLSINEVLSLSSIMFRMKSNALLLTVITTISALAIGLLSLSYISYYSAEKLAQNNVVADFSLTNKQDAENFKKALEVNQMKYTEKMIDVIQVSTNIEQITEAKLEGMNADPRNMIIPVISDKAAQSVDLSAEEALFTGYNDLLQKFMPLKSSGQIELQGNNEVIPQKYLGLRKDYIISYYFTSGGLPVAIVDETIFERLKKDMNPGIQKESTLYIGIDLKDKANIEEATDIFQNMNFSGRTDSRLDMSNNQKQNMGLIMFIVGFLGLTFLVTSGCILYFKQMDESEEEKSNYTILRKLGFTQGDLLKGVQAKQIFNFGIPLIIGLAHSYFAVKSGWFMFGTELWTPMIMVMLLYTVLYSIFGILSVFYYKKVIKAAL